MNFYTLSESWECLFSLLEAASPGALQVCSLNPTYMFSGCVEFRMGGYWRQKKMINSTPVQQYSKFWSSSPNYLLLFMFQSLHPLCLVFIVAASQYNPVECVFSVWSRTEKFPPHSLNQVRKGRGTLYIEPPYYLLSPPLHLCHEFLFHNWCFYHQCISKSSTGIVCNWSWGNFDVSHTEDYIESRQLRSISSFRNQLLLFKN